MARMRKSICVSKTTPSMHWLLYPCLVQCACTVWVTFLIYFAHLLQAMWMEYNKTFFSLFFIRVYKCHFGCSNKNKRQKARKAVSEWHKHMPLSRSVWRREFRGTANAAIEGGGCWGGASEGNCSLERDRTYCSAIFPEKSIVELSLPSALDNTTAQEDRTAEPASPGETMCTLHTLQFSITPIG